MKLGFAEKSSAAGVGSSFFGSLGFQFGKSACGADFSRVILKFLLFEAVDYHVGHQSNDDENSEDDQFFLMGIEEGLK